MSTTCDSTTHATCAGNATDLVGLVRAQHEALALLEDQLGGLISSPNAPGPALIASADTFANFLKAHEEAERESLDKAYVLLGEEGLSYLAKSRDSGTCEEPFFARIASLAKGDLAALDSEFAGHWKKYRDKLDAHSREEEHRFLPALLSALPPLQLVEVCANFVSQTKAAKIKYEVPAEMPCCDPDSMKAMAAGGMEAAAAAAAANFVA